MDRFFVFARNFFALKLLLFPAYGGYADYNLITIKKLIQAIPGTAAAVINLFNEMIICELSYLAFWWIIVIVFWEWKNRKIIFEGKFLNSILACIKTNKIYKIPLYGKYFKYFFVGVGVLYFGLFPYVVVKGPSAIVLSGFDGRHSILATLGLAICMWAFVNLFFRNYILKYVYAILVFVGIVYFNSWYVDYQKNYYNQLGLMWQLEKHPELSSCVNMICRDVSSGKIKTLAFYALNAIAEKAYGNQTRAIFCDFNKTYLKSDKLMNYFAKESGWYHMNDYDLNHKAIDAVLHYRGCIRNIDVVKLKYLEIIDYNKFKQYIEEHSELNVALFGSYEYDRLLDEAHYLNIPNGN